MQKTEDFRLASTHAAQAISHLRREHGWSRQELVRRLKSKGVAMHTTSLQRIENGDRPIRLDEALAVAAIFNIALTDLIESSDPTARADQAANTAIRQARKIGERLLGARIELQEIESDLQSSKKTSTVKETLKWIDKSIEKLFPLAEEMLDGPSHEKHLEQQSREAAAEFPAEPRHKKSPNSSAPMTPYERAVEAGVIGQGEEELFSHMTEMPLRPELHTQSEAEKWWRENERGPASSQ